jgi:putative acetyltransferase
MAAASCTARAWGERILRWHACHADAHERQKLLAGELVKSSIVITPGDLGDARVLALLAEHLTRARAATSACSDHALEASELKAPDVTFWSAWSGDSLVGIGALKRLSPEHGEIKSMHTAQSRRGEGVGSAMLGHIVEAARAMGLSRLSLETGSAQYFAAARRLYERHGFLVCPPFADYVVDPNSVYMSRVLR